MRIQKVQENPTFGYNKALNARTIEALSSAKKSKPFFNTLLKINELTNATEDLLRSPQIARNKSLTSKLEEAYVVLKSYFSSTMDYFFPKMNYSSIEAVTYAQEITESKRKITPESWQVNIMNILHENVQLSQTPTVQTRRIRMDAQGNFTLIGEDGLPIKQMTMDELPEEIKAHAQKVLEQWRAEEETVAEEELAEEASSAPRAKNTDEKQALELVQTFTPNETEKLGFAGLIGLDNVKTQLTRRIVNMLKDPKEAEDLMKNYGKKMPKGILLYGPPGCGKTSIAKALSVEADIPLLIPKAKLGDGTIHQTAQNIETIYNYAKSIATPEKPVLILFDDCEAAFMSRASGRVERWDLEETGKYLNCIEDGSKHNVITVATTNKVFLLDDAIKGRLGMQFELPFPDLETRKSILKYYLSPIGSCKKLTEDDNAMTTIANKLNSFSIRDYEELIQNATDKAAFDVNGRREVTLDDFISVIDTPEFQNKKIDMKLYASKSERRPVGFNTPAKPADK